MGIAAEPATTVAEELPTTMAAEPATTVAAEPATTVAAEPETTMAAESATTVAEEPATTVAAEPATTVTADPETTMPGETTVMPVEQKENVIDAFASLGESLINSINEASVDIINIVKKEPIQELSDLIPDQPTEVVLEIFDQLAENTKTFADELPEKIPTLVTKVKEYGDKAKPYGTKVKDYGIEVGNKVKDFGTEITNKITNYDYKTPLTKIVNENWNRMCKIIWWPFHDSHCTSMRCSVCAPAIMTAAQVCKKSMGRATIGCISEVFGENANCDFCISDYINSV